MTDFDSITAAQLAEQGSLKWTMFPDVINAWVAEMDFGTAPAIRSALQSAVERAQLGYLPPAVRANLAEACAAWYRNNCGWDIPVERIQPLPDVLKGLEVALTHYSAPGSAVIVPTPAYMPFLTIPENLGRAVIRVPMVQDSEGRYHYDLEAVDAAFAAGAGTLVICNPHNPLGQVLGRDEALAIAEIVTKHGGRVFSDEIHAPLTPKDRTHVPYASVSEAAASHTITAVSASKGWNLAGTKCAQLILSNNADLAAFEPHKFDISHGASTLGAIANTAAYSAGGSWLATTIDYLDGNRGHLTRLIDEHLPGAVFFPPEATYLAWIDCRPLNLPDNPVTFFAEHAQVVATDGAGCGAPGFIRFNFAMPRPLLTEALERMGRAVATHSA
ncbi:MAG TPA: aminotransferase class I/II-fold pyridoxal phosphate-dependent enzyme [Glaciihabitans sp.]|jgi:cystathionine beta-lyase|nr:aminotransferase class I/II-fold pyridoxal phosphate-dependent enzyme [Glaciihabitans sp.]